MKYYSNESSNNVSRNPTAKLEAISIPMIDFGVSNRDDLEVFMIISSGFWCVYNVSQSNILDLVKILGLEEEIIDPNRLALEKTTALASIGSGVIDIIPNVVIEDNLSPDPDDPGKPDDNLDDQV